MAGNALTAPATPAGGAGSGPSIAVSLAGAGPVSDPVQEETWEGESFVNSAPIALNDSATVAEDGSVQVDVLQNDLDLDLDPLSVTDWTVQSAHGTVLIVSEGVLEYHPEEDFHGTDSFTYTASDSRATATATVTVTVNPVDDLPVAFNDAYAVLAPPMFPVGESYLQTGAIDGLLHNDIDWDGTAVQLGTVNTAGLQGAVTVNPDGSFEYHGPAGFLGTTSFSYTVVADGQESAPATVRLEVAKTGAMDPAPQANPDYYFFGDDPLVVSAADGPLANDVVYNLAVLDQQPMSGKVTAFNFDGSFTYQAPKKDLPQFPNQPVRIKQIGIQDGPDGRKIVTGQAEISLSPVDLEISNGQGGAAVGGLLEEVVGAFTVANLNDTDGDSIVDKDDAVVLPGPYLPNYAFGQAETDMMKLVIRPFADPNNAGQKLTVTVSGPAKLYETSSKGQAIALNNGVVQLNLGDIQPNGKTLWVEATDKSGALRDISIQLEYRGSKDTVKATAIWAERTNFRNATQNISADLDDPRLRKALTHRFTVGGASWGPTMFYSKDGDGYFVQNVRNGMEMEFALKPSGIGLAARAGGVRFDVSRVIEEGTQTTKNGVVAQVSAHTFPAWKDIANDDSDASDEDNKPKNDHIYSTDFPGARPKIPTPNLPNPGPLADRWQMKMNALEFVRILTNGAEFADQNNSSQGTRASAFEAWYSRIDLVKDPLQPALYQRNNGVAGENEIELGQKNL